MVPAADEFTVIFWLNCVPAAPEAAVIVPAAPRVNVAGPLNISGEEVPSRSVPVLEQVNVFAMVPAKVLPPAEDPKPVPVIVNWFVLPLKVVPSKVTVGDDAVMGPLNVLPAPKESRALPKI